MVFAGHKGVKHNQANRVVFNRVLHKVWVRGDARKMGKAGPQGLALVMVAGYDVNRNRQGAS